MSSRATEAGASAPHHHSMRRRLLWLVLATIALASVLQAASAYRTALRNADALFDAHLQALARSFVAAAPGRIDGWEFEVQVHGPDGVLLLGSRRLRLPVQPVIGFSELSVDGVHYRVYALRTPHRTIQIAQDLDARRERARAMAVDAVLPIAAVGVLLMLAVWLVIDRSLRPVERVRAQVAQRPANDLAPLPEAGLPQEVLPLVQELNLLFARVGEAFRSRQQFVADAAHELRSPLAALKLQAQSLRRLPQGPDRDIALRRLDEGIARAIAMVSQLLALAREEVVGEGPVEDVVLADLCRDVVSELLPLALARRIDLGLDAADEQLAVRGERESLRTLLRNLVENALKFTPEGGRVDIELARAPGTVLLAVEDSGPGVPPAERERVFDRFYRSGATDVPGSGLGLAIVAAIARRHEAKLGFAEPRKLGGARVEVRFAAALSVG